MQGVAVSSLSRAKQGGEARPMVTTAMRGGGGGGGGGDASAGPSAAAAASSSSSSAAPPPPPPYLMTPHYQDESPNYLVYKKVTNIYTLDSFLVTKT